MNFSRLILILAALFGLSAPSLAGDAAPAQQAVPRQVTSLADGWRFRFGGEEAGITAGGFDDSAWEQVSVPHTWNRVGEYALTRSPATNNKQGIGWYRLSYDAKPMAKGRRIYIDFAAVGNIADVWINGAHVGQHKGAFTRFRFDVTPQWKPGAKNLIVVRADNSKPAVGSSTEHVIPLAGDFFIHGGMYRGVQLIEANDVGIDLLDFGGPGVYVRAGELGLNVCADCKSKWPGAWSSSVNSTIKLHNRSAKAVKLSVALTILDPAGRQMAAGKPKKIVLAPNAVNTLAMKPLEFGNVEPWGDDGKATLYVAKVSVYVGTKLIDSYPQSFGIRDFKFDPNTGLTLNGKPLKLRGVSRHQDRLGKGWALSAKDHAEDMAIMKEMGVNSVRHAHYPHADEWVEEADKAGMIVWAEVPYVTTPSLSGGEGSAEIFANAEQQTRELIRQQYNHPSILMWAAGNEVDAAMLFGASAKHVKALKLLQHINRIIKEEDPSRATIFADCCEDVKMPVAGTQEQPVGDKLAGATDLIGYNRYYGWYYPEPLKAAELLAREMDKLHAKHPALPISISEYGAGGAFGQHSDNIHTGFINAVGRPQPEEYLSWLHEQSWPVIRDRPYIFGSWVWNMYDFASDLRNEGDSVDINTKGLVSFDRTVKKDAFYYYKAQWNPEPMIHLTGKRYVDRAYSHMAIKAYTSQPEATLQLNGKRIGKVPCPDRICVWPGVLLQPGANKVTVSTMQGGRPIFDHGTFNGPDPDKGVAINAGDIAVNTVGGARFGSDNFVTGGTPKVLNQGGFGSKRSGVLKTVAAPDPALYDYWREGEAFSYAIPIRDGTWTVTIYTFQPDSAAADSTATMTIKASGRPGLAPFSIGKEAGGSLKGLEKSFQVTVSGGLLSLEFAGQGGKAVVAAIKVTPKR